MSNPENMNEITPQNPLKGLTRARIGLPRTGSSLASKDMMELKLAHSRARDALYAEFEQDQLAAQLSKVHTAITLNTTATDRDEYLLRPDKGRTLDLGSKSTLDTLQKDRPFDICIVVGDGLSPAAIHRSATPLISGLLPLLEMDTYRVSPLFLVSNARVAVGDEISELIQARLVIVLIGERPGLSVAESMGIYLTYAPRVGVTDADRNCISNIHPDGLSIDAAIQKLKFLIREAFSKRISGVSLKDLSVTGPAAGSGAIQDKPG